MSFPRVLVTGAVGNVAKHTLDALRRHGIPARVTVRNASRVRELQEFGASEVVVANGEDPAQLDAAFAGIELAIIILTPALPTAEARVAATKAYLDAAARAKFLKRLIFSTGLVGQDSNAVSPITLARGAIALEQYLMNEAELNVRWTIVRPGLFMENFFSMVRSIRNGFFSLPIRNARICPISTRDIGDVLALIAETHTGGNWDRKIIRLTGPEALTGEEIAEAISYGTGRKVTYKPLSSEEAYREFIDQGYPEWLAKQGVELYDLLASGYDRLPSHEYERIMGHKGMRMHEFFKVNQQYFH